jgi:TolB-like protein
MIGTTLGRYRIVAKLGEGGMGSVWRAEDPVLKRMVAIKLLSPGLWSSDTARQRFVREAQAASKLDHPAIATVFDVGESDGTAWIAYRFIDGETVATRTASGPLPLQEAVTVARDIASALAHAHSHGVLHRDVTAGNVMITRDGHGVLVDFGLALPERDAHLTSTGAVVGTTGYLAPEVLRGERADERSDLYGLGAVLYRMLAGRLPFEGGSPETLLYKVLNEPVPPPSELRPEISPALDRVTMRLLQRAQMQRYQSARELAEVLAESVPERGSTESGRRTIARWWRRAGAGARRVGRVRVGVVALTALALLVGTGWLAVRRGWIPGMRAVPPTIAVLPFVNQSSDPGETDYIASGLGEALNSSLALTERLRVLPWVTTQRVRADSTPAAQLAKQLHAAKVILGTLRSDGDKLRVSLSIVANYSRAILSSCRRWSPECCSRRRPPYSGP